MTSHHPISPPPELVQEWWEQADQYQDDSRTYFDYVATEAAQWGADQELEACCEWLKTKHWIEPEFSDELRAARRPKPPSLKKQALMAINAIDAGTDKLGDSDIIRRALEALPDE